MKVFMLGWEFPPHISGGLGTACYGITKALTGLGVDIIFVLPRAVAKHYEEEQRVPPTTGHKTIPHESSSGSAPSAPNRACRVATSVQPDYPTPAQPTSIPTSTHPTTHGSLAFHMPELQRVTFRTIDVMLSPYMTIAQYEERLVERQREIKIEARHDVPTAPPPQHHASHASRCDAAKHDAPVPPPAQHYTAPAATLPAPVKHTIMPAGSAHYAGDMLQETQRYAALSSAIARNEKFDAVHAHDWMTFPAGVAVATARKKPLVVHVHSTEIDRSGQHINERIFEIEKHGMQVATHVIAVSQFTKSLIVEHYGIAPEKISVVHNGIESAPQHLPPQPRQLRINQEEKIVLFLARITAQKGPEHFLAAARKVVDVYPDVKFVMAGTGDMIHQAIEMAAKLGIGHKVIFTGFLQGLDVERIFSMADLYVMPSVSEPFGIAPLEAMSHDVPVIISKQSGVAEVIDHALKVDFWDTDDLANKIVAVLRYPPLSATLRQRGTIEITQLTWHETAQKIRDIYSHLLGKKSVPKASILPDEIPPIGVPTKAMRPQAPPAPPRRTTPPKRRPRKPVTTSVAPSAMKPAVPKKQPAPVPAPSKSKRVAASRLDIARQSPRDARPVAKLHISRTKPAIKAPKPNRPSPKKTSSVKSATRAKKPTKIAPAKRKKPTIGTAKKIPAKKATFAKPRATKPAKLPAKKPRKSVARKNPNSSAKKRFTSTKRQASKKNPPKKT